MAAQRGTPESFAGELRPGILDREVQVLDDRLEDRLAERPGVGAGAHALASAERDLRPDRALRIARAGDGLGRSEGASPDNAMRAFPDRPAEVAGPRHLV